MKKVILFALVVVLFSGCRRYSQGFDAYFCTSTESGIKGYLFIDNRKIGLLPYIAAMPSFEITDISRKLLYVNLKAGRHLIQVKDIDGNILFSEKMKAGRSGRSSQVSTSIEKKRWYSRVKVKDKYLVAELMY